MPAEGTRRQRLLRLAAGALFLAIAAVVVLVVVNSSGSASGGDARHITGAGEVNRELKGIPQYGLILGEEQAPVELIEYGDLQCPVCQGYAEEILPPIIQTAVRSGEVKISFRNFVIIGPESAPAGTAALSAGSQERGWNYLEIFYRNQGEENSGYADEDFLTAVAKAAGVKDRTKWKEGLKTLAFEPGITTEQAENLGFTGTPSFAIAGPGTDGVEKLGSPGSTEALEEAIAEAG